MYKSDHARTLISFVHCRGASTVISLMDHGHLQVIQPKLCLPHTYSPLTSATIPFTHFRHSSNFPGTSSQEHSLSFSQYFSCPIQRFWYINYSFELNPKPQLLNTLISAPHALYFELNCFSGHFRYNVHALYQSFILCPTSTVTRDPSIGSPFSLISILPAFTYLEHLITLLLPSFTCNFLILHTLNHSVYTSSPLSQPLEYHLQITAGLSHTCHHSAAGVAASPSAQHSPLTPSIHTSHFSVSIFVNHDMNNNIFVSRF